MAMTVPGKRVLVFFLLILSGAAIVTLDVPSRLKGALRSDLRSFREARSLELSGQPAQAAEKYLAVAEASEDDELVSSSLFAAGQIYYLRLREYSVATEILRGLFGRFPSSALGRQAGEVAAEISREKLGDLAGAADLYGQLGQAAGSEEAQRYQVQQALCYLDLFRFDDALELLARVRESGSDSSSAEEVQFYYAYALHLAGRSDEALAEYERFLTAFPGSELAARAQFERADILEGQEDLTAALELYRQLEGMYPNRRALALKIAYLQNRLLKRHR